jgi:hypothetical protein
LRNLLSFGEVYGEVEDLPFWEDVMKRILPLLMLGLMGCGVTPIGKNMADKAVSKPAGEPMTSVAPNSPQAAPNPAKASTTATAKVAEPAEVPAAVEPAKTESQPQAKVAKDEPAAKDESVDDPTERTARIEAAREMDKNTKTVLRNQNWTITLGGTWSGVNGEGDLTYEGCDANGKCLSLKGGTASCRDGVCSQGWRNGDYSYSLSAPIVTEDQPTPSSTLRVYQGDKLILAETGLKADR